ncbi:hypothetical protein CCACVL1_24870 [Corchorus capsularis]|uniref:Uncharacterized protein n=1 Tax=Corchorus capsularis TaxID=210143 RepID=A0A1R3GMV1_COCAP|nr:hypothetical protein CCACVL1_24870 [Corchorus capsularis]
MASRPTLMFKLDKLFSTVRMF